MNLLKIRKRWVTHSLTYIHTTCNQEMPAHIKMVLLYWKWMLNFLVWLQSRKENNISWSIWLDGGQGLEKRKENRVFVSDHGFDQTMNYAYTGRTGGRQTSIQFTNRILFFISSSYPKNISTYNFTKKKKCNNKASWKHGWLHVDNTVPQSEPCLHGSYPHHSVPSTGAINPANDSF